MFYPHADDENVAMGYANYNHTEEITMVTINEKAFRTYMFTNYLSKLDQPELLELLEESVGIESLVDMAQSVWELPFDLSGGKVELVDPDALLLKHSEPEECVDCPDEITDTDWEDEEDYQIIEYDDENDEYAPYDEFDDNLEEIEK